MIKKAPNEESEISVNQFLRLSAVDRNRKEACYRMQGTEVMSPENYSYATGIFISSNAQRNEVE